MERQSAMCLMLLVLKVIYKHVNYGKNTNVSSIQCTKLNVIIFVLQEWFTLSSSVTDQEETY